MGWIRDIFRTRARDWIYQPLSKEQVPDGLAHEPIVEGKSYVSVFLRSMRIVDVRKGLSKFYGTVHSYLSLPHLGRGVAEIQRVVTPVNLKNQDAKNLDRVVQQNYRLGGPVPYRGGDVELELGLYSVKSTDLAGPYVDLLESMSEAAGASFLSSALPFAGPLKSGIELLTGSADASILEIGVITTYTAPETGYFVAMRAKKDEVDVSALRVTDDYLLVGPDGKAVRDYPYMVVAVEASPQRKTWFQIPELKEPYDELKQAVRKGRVPDADEAFAVFKRTVLTSADLLYEDAQKLVDKVEGEVQAVLVPKETAVRASVEAPELPELESIRIYD